MLDSHETLSSLTHTTSITHTTHDPNPTDEAADDSDPTAEDDGMVDKGGTMAVNDHVAEEGGDRARPVTARWAKVRTKFNFSEFLALAHKVIDEGDDDSMNALSALKEKWEAKLGPLPTSTIDAHPLARGLRRARWNILHLFGATSPGSQVDGQEVGIHGGSTTIATLCGSQIALVCSSQIAPIAEPYYSSQITGQSSSGLAGSSLGAKETTSLGSQVGGPSDQAAGAGSQASGLFIGKVPLACSGTTNTLSGDYIADAFNNSSRKTLSYVAPVIQNDEVVVRPTLAMSRDGARRWASTAIGYFLGRKPYFHHLNEFKTVVAMEEVIEGGPWLFQGQPIILQQSESGMALRRHKHTQVPIWIHLRHLPVEFWMNDRLSTVASGIGRPLYQDAITKAYTILDFARVCVMLDISSTLPKHIVVMVPTEDGGETPCKINVEYEWLPPKCTVCYILGHRTKDCPSMLKSLQPTGLNRRDHQVAVSDLIFEFQLQFVGLLETRVSDRNVARLADSIDDEPWLVMGDFNTVADMSEVCGYSGDIRVATDEFQDCISQTGLITLPVQGDLFTWHNRSTDSRSLWKRLDRMLANDRWLVRWPDVSYSSLNARTSDHSPLVLRGDASRSPVRIFRFDNYLAASSQFIPTVQRIWRNSVVRTAMYSVTRKLKALKPLFRAKRKQKGDLSSNVKLAQEFWTTVPEPPTSG
ncbi:UNVERIFIED_CONTAM: hypothetical protein Slati_3081200 [Sesamum latifolium]|uniref:Endonuclease/exonuclease/phosphatase domain-containing protein n=1 Tax=Sesamum latifolium TaxID=2727402 RepID=A0AAW2UUP7_9LAMI